MAISEGYTINILYNLKLIFKILLTIFFLINNGIVLKTLQQYWIKGFNVDNNYIVGNPQPRELSLKTEIQYFETWAEQTWSLL